MPSSVPLMKQVKNDILKTKSVKDSRSEIIKLILIKQPLNRNNNEISRQKSMAYYWGFYWLW